MKPACFLISLMLLSGISKCAYGQENVADSLKRIIALNLQDTAHAQTLVWLAVEYARSDIALAKKYLFNAIQLAQSLGSSGSLSAAYAQLTALHMNTGFDDSARFYLDKLAKLAEHNPGHWMEYANYYHAAGLYYKNAGQFREALGYQLKALDLVKGNSRLSSMAGQLLNIGNTYFKLGEIRSAADYHIKALKHFEELNNLRGQSFCLQSLGSDFMQLKDYSTAGEYYERSLKIKEQLKDVRGIETACVGLGSVARYEKEFDKAMGYFNRALEIARELKLTSEEGKVLFEIGRIEKAKGNTEAALELFNSSYQKTKSSPDTSLLAMISVERIGLKKAKNSFSSSEQAFRSKVTMAERSGDKPALADGFKDLATLYASNHQYDKAYYFLLKHHELNDSIRGRDVLIQLKNIEGIYQQEKNEKEIALLKKDQELKRAVIGKQKANQYMIGLAFASVVFIAIILFSRYRSLNRAQRQVEIEKMRNHIARDLHDDIGSTLSSINLISQLALQENADSKRHLQRIAENSARMMENMSDIVWSINPTHDSFEQVIVKMKEFAAEILEPRNITYTISGENEVNNIPVDIEKRKNLFLIFKEAINNTAKYSGASKVVVNFKRDQDQIHFTITDDGTGFNPAEVKLGNGLKNMEARARLFNGSLSLKSAEPESRGTRIDVRFAIT